MRTILVVAYDPSWPALFEALRADVWAAVQGMAIAIEHVGSTSVPGLAAKPVIDMDIVVGSIGDLAECIDALALLGYRHLGDLGIEGREAFDNPPGMPAHNLYLCPHGSTGLRNHLAVRDYLRAHPLVARAYGELKTELARRYAHDIDAYVEGKSRFLLDILGRGDFCDEELAGIEAANKK